MATRHRQRIFQPTGNGSRIQKALRRLNARVAKGQLQSRAMSHPPFPSPKPDLLGQPIFRVYEQWTSPPSPVGLAEIAYRASVALTLPLCTPAAQGKSKRQKKPPGQTTRRQQKILWNGSRLLARHGKTQPHGGVAHVIVFQIYAKHIPPIFAIICGER